jgi:hypothetical protein
VDWVHLVKLTGKCLVFVNTLMNSWVMHNAEEFCSLLGSFSFSRMIMLHGSSYLDRKRSTIHYLGAFGFSVRTWKTTGYFICQADFHIRVIRM